MGSMGSKSSKNPNSNTYSQGYSSGSQNPRPQNSNSYPQGYSSGNLYPHLVPDTHQHYPIYEHRPSSSYVTAIPNNFNPGQVQNVAHVQGEYRTQQHTHQQANNNNVLHSPTAPPLSLVNRKSAQSNRNVTHTSIIDGSSKGSSEDGSKTTEKFKNLNRFLKSILATVPEHYAKKGYYCEACDGAYMRMTSEARRNHNKSQSHLQKKTGAMVERYCPICRIDLCCTDRLWKKHEGSEIHKFWKERSEKNCGAVQEYKEVDFNGKKPYLVVTGFPGHAGWKSLRTFFEDFGKCARVEMGKDNKGSEFARVFFSGRLIALKIHESGFPLIFENRRLTTRVEWMV